MFLRVLGVRHAETCSTLRSVISSSFFRENFCCAELMTLGSPRVVARCTQTWHSSSPTAIILSLKLPQRRTNWEEKKTTQLLLVWYGCSAIEMKDNRTLSLMWCLYPSYIMKRSSPLVLTNFLFIFQRQFLLCWSDDVTALVHWYTHISLWCSHCNPNFFKTASVFNLTRKSKQTNINAEVSVTELKHNWVLFYIYMMFPSSIRKSSSLMLSLFKTDVGQ